MSTNINERFLIPNGSSLTNIKNTFNDFITQVQNSSFANILRNSNLTDHFAGVATPYAWTVDSGISFDYSSPNTVVNFASINLTISQSIEAILEPINQNLSPNTEYLAIFDITPTNNCEVGLSYTAGLLNLLGTTTVGGEALYKTVYAGNTDIVYFVFKTAADFSNVQFYIKNTSASTNSITLKKLSLVKGTLNLLDSIESNLFLDHIRFDNNLLAWTYTNDGITWVPFQEINPLTQYIASYTPVHDQVPILSAVNQDPGQPNGGILPIGNGYRSAIVNLTIGPVDLNNCRTPGAIYTGDGSVNIPNAPYNNFDGTVWWDGILDGNGCQFANNSLGDVWFRACKNIVWSEWYISSKNLAKNQLINGNFDIWENGGISAPFLLPQNTSLETANKWDISTAAYYAGNIDVHQQLMQPENGVYSIPVPGSRYALNMTHPILNADVTLATRTKIEQRINDITRFVNSIVTFSFWANSSIDMTGTIYADIVPTGIPAVVGFNCNNVPSPASVVADANYLYVTNNNTNNVTRYDKATGIQNSTGFLCNTGMTYPVGIALDANYIYVTNNTNNVTRYDIATGTQNSTGFLCNTGMTYPVGIALDANYIYVTNFQYGPPTVTRYNKATGTQNSAGFLCNTGMTYPVGITLDTNYIYVTNFNNTQTVTRYDIATGTQNSAGFACNTGMNCRGITNDINYLYVTDYVGAVRRYDKNTGTENSSGFLCNVAMSTPDNVWLDSGYIYVTNLLGNNITRYDIATGAFDNTGTPNPGISTHNYEQSVNFIGGVYKRYSVTFNISNPPGLFSTDLSNPDFFAIGIIPNASTLNATPAYNFIFTQAQLEYGSVATFFDRNFLAIEELLCNISSENSSATLETSLMPETNVINPSGGWLTNSLQITPGSCWDIKLSNYINFPTPMYKLITVPWNSGSNAGGFIPMPGYTNLSGVWTTITGYTTPINTYYAVILIKNTQTGAVDVCFLQSYECKDGIITSYGLAGIAAATGWNINNIVYRRIMSVNYTGSAIYTYIQRDNYVNIDVSGVDLYVYSQGAGVGGPVYVQMFSPYGEVCRVNGVVFCNGFTTNLTYLYMYDCMSPYSLVPGYIFKWGSAGTQEDFSSMYQIFTNYNSQIYIYKTTGNGNFYISQYSYIDYRNSGIVG